MPPPLLNALERQALAGKLGRGELKLCLACAVAGLRKPYRRLVHKQLHAPRRLRVGDQGRCVVEGGGRGGGEKGGCTGGTRLPHRPLPHLVGPVLALHDDAVELDGGAEGDVDQQLFIGVTLQVQAAVLPQALHVCAAVGVPVVQGPGPWGKRCRGRRLPGLEARLLLDRTPFQAQ